jgi:hypothetical protein
MFLAVFFTLALAATGYAYADSKDRSPWDPPAACLGFVLCGLSVSGGWWLGLNAIPGMLAFCVLTLALGFRRFRSASEGPIRCSTDIAATVLSLALTALVGAEFFPLWRDGGTVYQLPNIYDLPKHISALAACARTTQFPVENPWLPNAEFAYQTSFYAPFAAVAAALGTSSGIVSVAALMPLVATFLLLMVLARAGKRMELSQTAVLCSLLLASVVGGYTTALLHPGPSLGSSLAAASRLGGVPWFEDPFTYLLFIPNHVFSATCILAAWLEATQENARKITMVRSGLLLAGAIQASGALVPHAAFAAGVLALFHWWSGPGQDLRSRLIGAASLFTAFGATALPFTLAAYGWAQGAEQVNFAYVFSFDGWMTQLLAIGPFALLGLVGLAMAALQGGPWRSFLALLVPGMAFLYAVPHMEIAMKSAMFLRLVGALAAALPIHWLFTQLRTKSRDALVAGLMLAFLHAAYFSSQLMLVQIKSAYVKWDPQLAALVKALQGVPFSSRIRIAPHNQELASLSGHTTFMDFTPIRRGGYLPANQVDAARSELDDLGQLAAGTCPESFRAIQQSQAPMLLGVLAKQLLPARPERPEAIGYVLIANANEFQCKGYRSVAPQVIDLGAERWSAWPGAIPEATLDPQTMTLASAKPIDAGLIRPLRLGAGRYRVRLQVSGTLTGPAHLSFHGKRKLLTIPPGDYKSQVFELPLEAAAPVSETLAFGLGGWAVGSGTIRMESLTISLVGTLE